MADLPTPAPVVTSTILDIEDALISRAKLLLGTLVRGVESLPGDWDDDMFRRLLRLVPGVFVVFSGGQRTGNAGQMEAAIDGRWSLVVATGHASGEAERRRGDSLEVGAYHLVQVLAAGMHGFAVPHVGSLLLLDVQNLYTGSVDSQGLAVYVLTFSLPMSFDAEPLADDLGYFVRFEAQLDIPPQQPELHRRWLRGDFDDGRPDATDTVILPNQP